MISARQWMIAAVLAIGVHAALFGLAIPSQELAMERSAGREGAVWGLPMESIADSLEPEEAARSIAETGEPVEPDPAEVAEAEPVEPIPTETTPTEHREITEPAVPTTNAAEPVTVSHAAEPVATESLSREPSETVAVEAWDGGIAVAEPVSAAETAPIEPTEVRTAMLTSAEVAETVEAEDHVPLPMVRPADVPRIEAAPEPAKAKPAAPTPPKQTVSKPTQAKPTRQRPAAATNQAGTAAGTRASAAPAGEQVGSGGKRVADGGRALLSSYAGRVAAHLQRYKRYPGEAARQRLAGTVIVTFTLGADGRVRGANLARGSGQSVFDKEVLAMVQRASPFPPIPADTGRSSYTFTVPVHFKPR